MTRRNTIKGKVAESIVGHRLRLLGFLCVEQVATPMLKRGGRMVYARKVSGDFRCVRPGGQYRSDGTLDYGDCAACNCQSHRRSDCHACCHGLGHADRHPRAYRHAGGNQALADLAYQ